MRLQEGSGWSCGCFDETKRDVVALALAEELGGLPGAEAAGTYYPYPGIANVTTMVKNKRQQDPLLGRWRIVEMDLWEPDVIDLAEPAFIEFRKDGTGPFGFIAVQGWMDFLPAPDRGRAGVEFTWEGNDESTPVSGRGWAALTKDWKLEGHLYFHLGDHSAFLAERFNAADRPTP